MARENLHNHQLTGTLSPALYAHKCLYRREFDFIDIIECSRTIFNAFDWFASLRVDSQKHSSNNRLFEEI